MLTITTPPSASLFQRIQPWLVIFTASLFFFFEFMQVNMFNAIDPSLYKAFHLTDTTQLGELSACYMYANVLFLFPAGIILDRISTRKLILLAMFTCVVCAFLFSLTTSLWQASICRLITGIAGAFCLLSCVRLASRWFPSKHMALVVGLVVTFAMLGAMIAQTPFTEMTKAFGWRTTIRIDATSGLLMLLLIAIIVRDYPSTLENFFKAEQHVLEKIGFWRVLKSVAMNAQNWLGGLYVSLINLPIFLLGSTWGSWYLVQAQHLNRLDASFVTSMIFIGMIIGSPMIGWISDYIGKRKMPMIVGAITSLFVIFTIMYLQNLSLTALLILFFVLGFVISSQILGYPLIAESNPRILTGAAEGLASTLIMAGGFMIPVFPMLLDLHWNHQMKNGIPFYSTQDFHLAFFIMPIAFFLALLVSFFVRETNCEAVENQQTHSFDLQELNFHGTHIHS